MNARLVTNAKPAATGAIFNAPLGTTLPTNSTAELADEFVELGYVSDDGWSNDASFSSDDIKAWGGDIVLSYRSETNDAFTFTLIEAMNKDVLATVYGDDNVTGTLATGIEVKKNAKEGVEKSWVIDSILRGNALKRVVIPAGKVTALEEITYADEEVVGYEITVTATPDENGNSHYEYIKAS